MIGVLAVLLSSVQVSGAHARDIAPSCSFLHIIEFEAGSTELSSQSRAILDNAASGYVRWREQIRVTGYGDGAGNHENDALLAQRRAEAVRDYLTRQGLLGSQIHVGAAVKNLLMNPASDSGPVMSIVEVIDQMSPDERVRRREAEMQAGFSNRVC